MATQLAPVGPAIPAEVAEVLLSHERAIGELQQPQAPSPTFAVDAAASLPPAADYPLCQAIVEDSAVLAISVRVAGVWTWKRADGSSL